MATFPVKYVNDAMRGAPVLSGTAGSLISVLDAFLITGFGLTTAQSVTVDGGIATATVQAGNSFDKDCIVLVDGATPAALNGEQRVLTSSSTAITFATTAPDGAATGTITIKVAPVGWQKLFSGTNKAVYSSTDPQASGFCLWVDDTASGQFARVRGFETMSDVDTGAGPFPTNAQISGGGYWPRSSTADAKAVRYDLIADSRFLIWAIAPFSTQGTPGQYVASIIRGFGDVLPMAVADGYACALSCTAATLSGYGTLDFYESGENAVYVARPPAGIGDAQKTGTVPYVGEFTAVSGVDSKLGPFPSPIDGQLKYSRRYLRDSSSAPRANVPGLLYIPQSGVTSLVNPRDTFAGSGDVAGRKLLALGVGGGTPGNPHSGIALVDITGPWR